ncbi:glycosyltransferase [uncultured Roseovarius sp.]|uniref:glycosyltransferase n=1 Tax=uncultured Roseovarius sp. TaxID=293344 RepID=UPI00262AA995|nr:glycosyltransferase [uncultured Roseovarius sp.]
MPVTVAISTIGPRLSRLVLPPACPGIDYLVMVQKGDTDACPDALSERDDVTVSRLCSVGLSHSRNAAFEHATGALLVFADDDMTLDTDGFCRLARAFTAAPDLGFAAGWRSDRLPGAGRRGRPHRLHHFNSGRICAPELMVRRSAVEAAGLRFDPDFGLGARFGLGEEYVFVTDALKAGLRGLSLPVAVGRHPSESTGDNWCRADLMQARVAVLGRVFGRYAPLVRVLYALRYRRRIGGLRHFLAFVRGHIPDSQERTAHDDP